MDNKRWYSRFGTVFWWTLAILPFLIPFIQFIGYHLTFNSGIASASELADYHANSAGSYIVIFNSFNNSTGSITISPFSISFIKEMFYNLFVNLNFSTFYSTILSSAFGWMASVAFYHVLFDFSVWIFNWIHSLFERWGCFK